jgi:hypothetical protein
LVTLSWEPRLLVSAIREQIVWGSKSQNRTQPVVMRLTGREGKMDRQAIGVHHGVNLAGQAPSRATDVLVIVVCDTGSMLMLSDRSFAPPRHDRRPTRP